MWPSAPFTGATRHALTSLRLGGLAVFGLHLRNPHATYRSGIASHTAGKSGETRGLFLSYRLALGTGNFLFGLTERAP